MIKDEFSPEEKNVEGINDLGFIPISDKAPTPTSRSWFGKDIISDYVRFDSGNLLLHSPTEDVDRFFAGRDKNGEYVVKLSKPGVDVEDATNSQVLFSTNVIFFEHIYTSNTNYSSDVPSIGGSSIFNFVLYDTTVPVNGVAILPVYKESDWTITEATLALTTIASPSGADYPNLTNASIYINPTRSIIGFTYYRYSAGTTITTGLAITGGVGVDEVHTYNLTSTQIAAITNGWNKIIVQNETDADEANAFNMTLIIRGYVNL